MNLELLRTFDASYPEHNDGVLDSGSEALITQFNRRGTMLAVGCNDGRIALWDFMTRGIYLPPVQSPRPSHNFTQLEQEQKKVAKFRDRLERRIMGCR